MSQKRIISSDSHVFEPVDLWTTRGESRFKDRAPRVESKEDGDYWIFEGVAPMGAKGDMAQPGDRFAGEAKATGQSRADEVLLGGYIPEEHIKDMDLDGVDVPKKPAGYCRDTGGLYPGGKGQNRQRERGEGVQSLGFTAAGVEARGAFLGNAPLCIRRRKRPGRPAEKEFRA